MGNIISSFVSGFAKVVGNLFGSPLDFLAGKSCSSICGSTWDFNCYIENFCIANLLKMVIVLVLFYIVLLFFYLLYKLGICQYIGRSLCKMVWACFHSCFSAWEYGCTFLCYKLLMLKQRSQEHKRDIELFDSSEEEEEEGESFSYNVPRPMQVRRSLSRRWRDYRGNHLRRSLRPRSHRIQVGISGDYFYVNKRNPNKHGNHVRTIHDIRVTRTSKFVQKGANYKGAIDRRNRW